MTWSFDTSPMSVFFYFLFLQETNSVFIQLPESWQYIQIEIERPNRGNIPTSSPCGNTMPADDTWIVSLPGPPSTHHSLG